jgi:hypothetical protein
MQIFIDIETVPAYADLKWLDPIGLSIWEQKYSKELHDYILITPKNIELAKQEHRMNKAWLIAEFGKIVCISCGYERVDWSFVAKSYCFTDESAVLSAFHEDMQAIETKYWSIEFVWWNLKNFDLPWISKKMLKHKISTPKLPKFLDNRGKKPWEISAVDMMEEYKLWWSINASLGVVAWYLLWIWAKEDLSGDQVASLRYSAEPLLDKIAKISKYCESDIEITWKIYKYLNS